jgi:hypothetical protein
MNYSFIPSVYSVDTASISIVRDARTLHGRATKGALTAFTNQLRHGEALAALDERRAKGLLINDADGKPLTKEQLVDYVGTLRRAMFFRYIQASKIEPSKIEAYVNELEEGETPNISGLIQKYATKKETAKAVTTLTKAKDDNGPGFTVSVYADGTFKATQGADPKQVKAFAAMFLKFKG